MGFMDTVRDKMRSFLQLEPPRPMQISIYEGMDYQMNAIKNKIWYRGESNELEQLYTQVAEGNMRRCFWASRPTPGMEIRKIHTGLPAIIADRLAGIVVGNLNSFEFESAAFADLWDEIAEKNRFKKLLDRAVKETLYIGDGAFKISVDPAISEYPLLEFFPGDRVEYTTKRGMVTEVIFRSQVKPEKGKAYELREIYGIGYVRYELYKDGEPTDLRNVDELADLQNVEFGSNDRKYMWAVPIQFFPSGRWEGRGQSIFDAKTENFDALDEAWSQWMDALRAGRTKTYIPDRLLPRDPNTGVIRKPNAFDDRYIATGSDMSQNATNKIQTEQPAIPHDSYIATYTTALDQCLQGLISPSTLGIDIKKLDNAEAQREKEKVTLYTRDSIVESLQADLKQLIETTLKVCFEMRSQAIPEKVEVDVSFGDYANPSFESQIETIGKAKQQGIMSTEAAIDELYGDDRSEEWKKEEVARLKAEQGIVDMEEPALNLDGMDIYGDGNDQAAGLQDA